MISGNQLLFIFFRFVKQLSQGFSLVCVCVCVCVFLKSILPFEIRIRGSQILASDLRS